MSAVRILALAGSARRASFNKQLVRVAAEGARRAGAEVTLVDLADFAMPLYDGDLESESGLPAPALALQQLLLEHNGLLLACPEYNSSITPLLKNTIDWTSRPAPGVASLAGYRGKAAALMSASPSVMGGLRGLVTVRSILGNMGVLMLPDQVTVARAPEAFEADGRLKDAKQQAAVENLGAALATLLGKLRA